jgi:hypothetical protein
MIKMVTLLKRKQGMSMEEFISHYEARHSKIGEKYLFPHATRYVRRYLYPLAQPAAIQSPVEQHYDVITEIWFPDQSAMDAAFSGLSTNETQAEILEDELKLFDRSRIHSYRLEERESDPARC